LWLCFMLVATFGGEVIILVGDANQQVQDHRRVL
jgi:hypothetical protein